MTGTSRYKTLRHSFRSKSEITLLYTAVGTNDVIGTAHVSNGVLRRHKSRLKFTFCKN